MAAMKPKTYKSKHIKLLLFWCYTRYDAVSVRFTCADVVTSVDVDLVITYAHGKRNFSHSTINTIGHLATVATVEPARLSKHALPDLPLRSGIVTLRSTYLYLYCLWFYGSRTISHVATVRDMYVSQQPLALPVTNLIRHN